MENGGNGGNGGGMIGYEQISCKRMKNYLKIVHLRRSGIYGLFNNKRV